MNQSPMIEILLATYNGARYLDEQIQSILLQDYTNWTILVRDDGSTDSTLSVLSRWRDVLGDKMQFIDMGTAAIGVSGNFGKLIDESRESYLMLCDQDDFWLPQKITKSLRALQEAESRFGAETPILVCSDLEVVNEDLKTISPSFWKDRKDNPNVLGDFEKLIAHSVVTGNTMMMNRPAARISIPIRTDFFLYDQWISIKIARHGQIVFLNESLVKYRQHGNNVLGSFRFSKSYLLSKIKFIPYYVRSWMRLKEELKMNFSVTRVLIFKIKYNLTKIFHG